MSRSAMEQQRLAFQKLVGMPDLVSADLLGRALIFLLYCYGFTLIDFTIFNLSAKFCFLIRVYPNYETWASRLDRFLKI